RAQVCKASTDANGNSLLAGDYCPHESVEEKIFIRRPVPYVPTKAGEKAPSDLKYELPEGEYCNIHGPSMEQTPSDIPNTPDEKPYDRTLWIDFLDELDQTLPRVFRRDD
ncbi:MAG TPA: penicillin-binding protein, partial [Clostridium sp.]|nr:penicillin-binding protein [Clostridium sp.]